MATAVQHYSTYKPRPFVREEREKTTILFGGLTWKHERLVQGVFHNLNYNAQPLPNVARADLDAGKELIDVGACCPTIFTSYLRKLTRLPVVKIVGQQAPTSISSFPASRSARATFGSGWAL